MTPQGQFSEDKINPPKGLQGGRNRRVTRGKATHFTVSLNGNQPKGLQFRSSPLAGVSEDAIPVIRDVTLKVSWNA